MRLLKLLTAVMGVLIVAGTAALVVLIVHRMAGSTGAPPLILAEPSGSRITGIAAAGGSIAVTLQGGGPDRILLLDARTLHPIGRLTITGTPAHP